MTRSTSILMRAVGTVVAAAIVVLGMPSPPASAAPTDHVTITANTTPIAEGNSGTTAVTFAIAYTGPPNAFSIDWATANGTATAGSDYVGAGGTVSFSGVPSDRTKTATVLINGRNERDVHRQHLKPATRRGRRGRHPERDADHHG